MFPAQKFQRIRLLNSFVDPHLAYLADAPDYCTEKVFIEFCSLAISLKSFHEEDFSENIHPNRGRISLFFKLAN